MTENQRRKRAAERSRAISEADYAMGTAEIAAVLRCSHQNVSVSLQRSFRKIRKFLLSRGMDQAQIKTLLDDVSS